MDTVSKLHTGTPTHGTDGLLLLFATNRSVRLMQRLCDLCVLYLPSSWL